MIDSLYIGATGMNAQQTNVDTTANNLANVSTTGFKRSRVEFEDLLYRAVAAGPYGNGSRVLARVGAGTAVAGTTRSFGPGDIKKTGEPLDLAIEGQGLFELLLTDGTLAYSRNGAFRLDSEGFLVNQDAYRLSALIQVPPETQQIRVEKDGRVFVRLPDEVNEVEIGRLDLMDFVNPGGLTPLGNTLYGASDQAGPARPGTPGENGLGVLQQGFLESSNVKLIDELVGLILAQRAYEINSRVVQASDELLTITNNLYRIQ